MNTIEVGYQMLQECKKLTPSQVSVNIGISVGYVRGGIVENSKLSFNIIGSGFDQAMLCNDYGSQWTVIVDEATKDLWMNDTVRKLSLCFFQRMPDMIADSSIYEFRMNEDALLNSEPPCPYTLIGETNQNNKDLDDELEFKIQHDATSPFAAAKRERGLVAYVGDLRFRDAIEEQSFQHSLKTRRNCLVTKIQVSSATICSIIYGYIDYEILRTCSNFDMKTNAVLWIRITVGIPVIIVLSVCFFLGKHTDARGSRLLGTWDIPLIVGTVYGALSLLRLEYIFGGFGLACPIGWRPFLFLYSEIYQIAIYFVSSVTITPVFFLIQFLLWVAYSGYIMAEYFYLINDASSGSSSPFILYANNTISAFIFFSVFTMSRDISSRREYLDVKYLNHAIEKQTNEKKMYESALLSTLNKDVIGATPHDIRKAYQILENAAIISLDIQINNVYDLRASISQDFDIISGCIKLIENMCVYYRLRMVKNNGSCVIIVCEPGVGSSNRKLDDDDYIKRCISFSFQVQSALELIRNPIVQSFRAKIVIDIGDIVYGLIGKHHFVFDCAGLPVSRALYTMRHTLEGNIYVTENVHSYVGKMEGLNTHYLMQIETKMGDRFSIYQIKDHVNVWDIYIKNVEWIGEDEITVENRCELDDGTVIQTLCE